MNWVKKFNKLEKEYTDDKIYKMCTTLYSVHYPQLEDIERRLQNLLIEVKYDGKEFSSKEDMFSYIKNTLKEIDDICVKNIEKVSKMYNDFNKSFSLDIKDIFLQIMDCKWLPHEGHLISKRTQLFYERGLKQVRGFISSCEDCFEESIESCKRELMEFMAAQKMEKKNTDKDENKNYQKCTTSTISHKKIFSYTEMETLAKNKGFIYKWSSGSHRIYEHKKTNKIVVIPSHDLGLGLSCKIQRQISLNCI